LQVKNRYFISTQGRTGHQGRGQKDDKTFHG
jgi:hypothetical protein